jgi:hypothetical protein
MGIMSFFISFCFVGNFATMIEWKEREHEMDDLAALRSPRTRAALRACGLLKFFKLQKMKKKILLLEHMIGLWNVAEQGFCIGTQLLTIELEDVYFLTASRKERSPYLLLGRGRYSRKWACIWHATVFWEQDW